MLTEARTPVPRSPHSIKANPGKSCVMDRLISSSEPYTGNSSGVAGDSSGRSSVRIRALKGFTCVLLLVCFIGINVHDNRNFFSVLAENHFGFIREGNFCTRKRRRRLLASLRSAFIFGCKVNYALIAHQLRSINLITG